MPTPEEIEQCLANAYTDYLEQQSDYNLVVVLHHVMCNLIDKDFNVREFDRRKELIQMITELDFTGKFDVSGFEDQRNSI
jgi:hypothetical protein